MKFSANADTGTRNRELNFFIDVFDRYIKNMNIIKLYSKLITG